MVRIAQGVTGGGILQSDHGTEVTRRDSGHILSMVGMHLEQTTDTLFFSLRSVLDIGTRNKRARIDAYEGESSHIGIGHNLKGESRRRGRLFSWPAFHLTAIEQNTFDRRNIEGARQIERNGIQDSLHSFIP